MIVAEHKPNSWPAATGATRALRAFLSERRSRLDPAAFGLPVPASRRRPGLSREDVAELLGVSVLWYALFESGSAGRRFSAAFIHKVADVLRLDSGDRATLLRLVVENGHAAKDAEAQWQELRMRTVLSAMADAAGRLEKAPSDACLVLATLASLRELLLGLGFPIGQGNEPSGALA